MTLRFYSLNNIPVCHTAVLTVVIMSMASLVLTYLITEGLYLSTTFGGMLLWRWPRWPSSIWDGLLLGPTLLSLSFWWWWLRWRAEMMSAAAAALGCVVPHTFGHVGVEMCACCPEALSTIEGPILTSPPRACCWEWPSWEQLMSDRWLLSQGCGRRLKNVFWRTSSS